MAEFCLRLLALIQEKGLKNPAAFEAAIGMKNAFYRWKTLQDKPTPDTLIKIANYFGVSVEYLITGKEAGNRDIAPQDAARPLGPLEIDMLNESLNLVENVLQEQKMVLNPEQKHRLAIQIYNYCAEDKVRPDEKMVRRYLSIIHNMGGGNDLSRGEP